MPASVIINFCPTGMVPTKKLTPYVPVSATEIIEQTHEAWELGITIVHLHARYPNEQPAWEPELYREIIEGIRQHCKELVICTSTSGRDFSEFEKRSAVIELKPDMCSLTLSSLNFMHQASVNSPDTIVRLAEKMKLFGVAPELECFDPGMINYGLHLIKKNVIEGPNYYWNLLFGNISGMQANALAMGAACAPLSGTENYIAFGGLGEDQLKANMCAIALGFGVRVGIEDNIWWNKPGKIPCTNKRLIQRIHTLIEVAGAELMPSAAFGNLGFYNRTK